MRAALAALLLMVVSIGAHAWGVASPTGEDQFDLNFRYYLPGWGTGPYSIDAGAACAAAAAQWALPSNNGGNTNAQRGYHVVSTPKTPPNGCSVIIGYEVNQNGGGCTQNCTWGPAQTEELVGQEQTAMIKSSTGACPANSYKVGTTCMCALAYGPAGGQAGAASCVKTTCLPLGAHDGITRPDVEVSKADTNQCVAGCEVVANKVTTGPDGKMWAAWPFTSKGATKYCGGPTAPDVTRVPTNLEVTGKTTGNEAPIPCKSGTCPGTVNGALVCVACSASTTSKDTINGDGTSAGRDVTTCSGSQCTTTHETGSGDIGSTTIGASGSGAAGEDGKDGEKGEEMAAFCEQNPNSAMCKISTIGGACGSVSCDGDAIQCAIAKEQAKRNCELFDENASSVRGKTASEAGDKPDFHPGATANVTTVPIGQGGFDQTDLIGGGCPADFTVPLGGATLSVPLSKLCSPAAWLGNVLMGITALACFGIVAKGVN